MPSPGSGPAGVLAVAPVHASEVVTVGTPLATSGLEIETAEEGCVPRAPAGRGVRRVPFERGKMVRVNERNRRIVEEFRANGGVVGGHFEGASLLILHTTGRRTGREHVTPLVYLPDGDRYVVFGSKGGAPTHPEWYLNLTANPEATVEVGARTIRVRATEITGPERDELYARQVERWEPFRDYPTKTSRVIPAIALEAV